MDKLNIVCVSDFSYLPFARVLFNSIKCNSKIPYKLHFHTVDVSDVDLNFFRDTYEDIEITKDELKLDETPDENNKFGKSRKASYCTNIRAKIIYDLMVSGCKYILYLDVDSIVFKDLNLLFDMIKNASVLVRTRDDSKKLYTKVLAGVIGFNNNDKSLKFVKLWKTLVLNNLYRWGENQSMFGQAMKSKLVTITPLPWEYIDTAGYAERSFIWCGKGDRKFDNKKYIQAMEKYK